MAKHFAEDFRRFFFRGLAAVLPTVLTLAIIVWVFSMIQEYVGKYINKSASYLYAQFYIYVNGITDPSAIGKTQSKIMTNWDMYFFWVGFVLAIIGVYIIGRLLASFLGKYVWKLTERTLIQLPVIKQIYPSVKQVTDFLLAERKMEYSKVVAVEYPRKGIWSLGLVTNPAIRTLSENLSGPMLTVFIPSSPTPVTGYTITVRQDEVIDLPISIDEALRFTISGGVIQPPSQRTGEVQLTQVKPQNLTGPCDKEICE